jgi:hypothetical protein
MPDWWHQNVVEPGKLPLLACTAAFLVTFAVTRAIVRLVRAGRGPFHDVTVGSVHVHHAVPGIVLMTLGGVGGLATASDGWPPVVAGMLFGIGLALVLDEFALVLHLQDVYWSAEGRTSVDAVLVVTALLVLLLLGFTPLGVDDLEVDETNLRWLVTAWLVLNASLVVVTLLKGKLRTGLFGLLVPPVAAVGAVRLARPNSPWSRWFYADDPAKQQQSAERAAAVDRRWGARLRRLQDLVAGAPTAEKN